MSEPQIELPTTVFYSYAHEDEPFRKELDKHLSSLRRSGIIAEWYDRQIIAGTNREDAINTHLNTATVILLLISPDFLASDYCFGMEMQRALERHSAGEAYVIPIILRPVDWRSAPFAALQCLPHDAKPVTTWSNIDEAFLDVTDGIREIVESIKSLPVQSHSLPLPPVWNIPYPRNPFFTGREDLLVSLWSSLKANRAAALTQPQAISGLGGIGKTQIAVEYAYRYKSLYQAVLWVQSETHESLVSSFFVIAHLLRLSVKDARDQNIVVKAVMEWMKTHTNWLLIFDNSDDLSRVRIFIPPVFGGHILLTTRAQAMGGLARRIEVETMAPEVGVLLLLRRATLIPSDALWEQASAVEREIAMHIVQELGGLPLALDQAGAYVEETGCNLADYLKLFQVHRSALLKRRGGFMSDHPAPVAATWLISFKHIERTNPVAAEVLRFCAFLYPDTIPEEILTKGISLLEERLPAPVIDPLIFNEILETLRSYSFVKRDVANHTLSIHRLVQVVLKDEMSAEEYQRWAEKTVHAVNKVFPREEFASWPLCERYITNAQACAELIESSDITFPEAAYLLNNAGWYLKERGQYLEAEPFLQRALAIREKSLGLEHPDTAISLNSLGSLSFAQGKYAQAEQFHRKALAIREQYLGTEHLDTAVSLNNLAWICYALAKYAEAEELYTQALSIREQRLGLEHSNTMTSMTNLAWLYYRQGRYAEAEQVYKRVLAAQERRLGLKHPNTARTLNNLALLYTHQGRYIEAETLQRQAFTIWEQCFGVEHPETMMSQSNLAFLYREQGKYDEAEQLYIQVLIFREQRLGAEHPDTVKSLYNLARLYRMRGRYSEAEPLVTRALTLREQHLGAEHPDAALCLNEQAILWHEQGRDAEAESLYIRVLAILDHHLLAEHPDAASCLYNLGRLYDTQGKLLEAENLYTRAFAILEQRLGRSHHDTIFLQKNLASFLRKVHRVSEAEQLEARIPPNSLPS